MENLKSVKKYCKDVVKGNIPAGELLTHGCERFLSDLKREDLLFDEEEAEKITLFFETVLRHWEGKWRGLPMLLSPFQKFVLYSIFCVKYKSTGRRKTKTVYIQIARKNGKTTLIAGIALYHLLLDSENTPQVLVGANNEDQAKICTNTAGQICKVSPDLKKEIDQGRLRLFEYKGKVISIVYGEAGIESMSKNADTKDGFNPSLGIIDEYHEAPDAKLLNVIESGQGAREQPLMICITTAGFNKQGPCYTQLRDQSIKVLEGINEDESHLAVICEPDSGDDWMQEETWRKSNQMLNEIDTILPYLESRYVKAKNEGGTKEVDFKTKNLNIWTDAPEVWIQDHIWSLGVAEPQNIGQTFYAGLDLARKRDFSAYVLTSDPDDQGFVDVFCWFWIPEENLAERERNDKNNYKSWIDQGLLFVTKGNATDFDEIEGFIVEKHKEFNIHSGAYDPAFATQMATHLVDQGLQYMELTQTYRNLTEPIQEIEALAGEGKFRHGNHPVLRWNCANSMVKRNPGGQMILDKSDESKKIDGMAALVNSRFQYLYSSRSQESGEIVVLNTPFQ